MKFCKVKATIFVSFFFIFSASAQFNTITRSGSFNDNPQKTIPQSAINQSNTDSRRLPSLKKSALSETPDPDKETKSPPEIQPKRKSPKFDEIVQISDSTLHSLPLTLPNLVLVMRHYRIKHPRIVLAQAIQETGWLRSNVCRTKNNLFGLTDPRTGTYYEFNHWTESVAAYYSKVQYRYKGGNYLLWLKKIGYAEDPGYILAVIKILKQL